MDFIECCRTGSRPEAEMIGQILFAQNIRCVVSCDDAGGGLPSAGSVARILVEADHLDEASAVIRALQNEKGDVQIESRRT